MPLDGEKPRFDGYDIDPLDPNDPDIEYFAGLLNSVKESEQGRLDKIGKLRTAARIMAEAFENPDAEVDVLAHNFGRPLVHRAGAVKYDPDSLTVLGSSPLSQRNSMIALEEAAKALQIPVSSVKGGIGKIQSVIRGGSPKK